MAWSGLICRVTVDGAVVLSLGECFGLGVNICADCCFLGVKGGGYPSGSRES